MSTTNLPRIDLDALTSEFKHNGYVIVSGLFTSEEMDALEAGLVEAQRGVADGSIDRARYGGDYLTSADPGAPPPFVNYVRDVTRLCPAAYDAFHRPELLDLLSRCLDGAELWEFPEEYGDRFGVVYQDARPGEESAYTRIGWHSDHQAYPNSDFHPSIALTFHIDGTSPANGFLRVVPESHTWTTDGMPLGFEKISGEVAVYCERGDVILHHYDLWHAAARASEDAPGGVRRHLRGSWHVGRRPEPGEEIEPFNKNAAR